MRVGKTTLMKVLGSRWLLLLVFPVGFLWTYPLLAFYRAEYLLWTAVAMCACAVLLTRLRTLAIVTWPLWILLAAFVLGYFIKFYILLTASAAPSLPLFFVVPPGRLELFADSRIALDAFRLFTSGFAVFCAGGWFLAGTLPAGPESFRTLQRKDLEYVVRVCLILGLGIFVVTSAIAVVTNSLAMGVAAEQHSFRLLGWIFYSRVVLLVVLILLVLQSGLVTNTRQWILIGAGFLIMLAVSDVLIRSTRAGLISAAIAIFFMYSIVRQRIEPRMVRLFAAFFLLTLILFPVITQYRSLRIEEAGVGLDVFMRAFSLAIENAEAADIALSGAIAVLMRFVGVDSMVFLTEPQEWLGLQGVLEYISSSGTVTHYFTHTVVGIPLDQVHADAPSLMGWFLIVGGWWGITLYFVAYLLLAWMIWSWICRSDLLTKPLVQVQFLLFWFTMSSEGTLDGTALVLSATIISLVVCELFVRSEHTRRLSRQKKRILRLDHEPVPARSG
jgi:hypothetical protein